MSLTKALSLLLTVLFVSSAFAQEEAPITETAEVPEETSAAPPAPLETASSIATNSTSASKPPSAPRRRSSFWGVSVSSLSWNDKMTVSQGTTSDTEYANYNAFILSVQKEYFIRRWGYSVGLFAGIGQANGGGNSRVVTYNQSKLSVALFGATPRLFYRLTEKITLGGTAMLMYRKADWPSGTGQSIEVTPEITGAALADVNLRLSPRWEFYQGIGPLPEGTTLWKLGVNYRF